MSDAKIVTLGEIMLRLKSPENTRLFQTPSLEATFGGGEANVAVALSLLGLDATFVTALPDNVLGDSARNEVRKYGVDTSCIVRSGSRLGVYYLEAGAAQRPSKVVYDRAASAIAEATADQFDWERIFTGKQWFHITGITPALSATGAELSLYAVKRAKEAGLTVSCDLNYRKKLWNYGKTAPEVMGELVKYVDVIIANEEDCQKSLGITSSSDVTKGELSVDHYRELATRVLEAYPNVQKIAITLRESISPPITAGQPCLPTGRVSTPRGSTTSCRSSIEWGEGTPSQPASSTGSTASRMMKQLSTSPWPHPA